MSDLIVVRKNRSPGVYTEYPVAILSVVVKCLSLLVDVVSESLSFVQSVSASL